MSEKHSVTKGDRIRIPPGRRLPHWLDEDGVRMTRIVFAYEHRYRVLDVQRLWKSHEGHTLITGIDPDKGEYRSFRVDRIQGRVRVARD